MAGAFVAYTVVALVGGNLIWAFVLAILASGALGVVIEFLGFRLLRNAPHTSSMLVTIGISIILVNAAQLIWGAETKSFPAGLNTGSVTVLGLTFTGLQLIVYGVTVAMIALIYLLLDKTKVGMAIRAASQDHEAAYVLGVGINRIYSLTFALGSALGGLAGVLVGLYYNAVYPTMGGMMGLKAFSACILGGLGSVPGAVVAGIFLGEVENLTVAYLNAGYRHVFSFAILILFLLFRPQGLFGRKESIR